MKEFIPHQLSIEQCRAELKQFEELLKVKTDLSERQDILPFFQRNLHVGSFISTYVPQLSNPDRIATELDIFGDFTCDLAVGDSTSKVFLLIEFEDARPNSLFVAKPPKVTPEWAPRLEHGFSQVVDWLWKLSDLEKSVDFENKFGTRQAAFHGMVIVGRDQALALREQNRLKWRQDHTVVHSNKVSILTFDQLARDLAYRLATYPMAAAQALPQAKPTAPRRTRAAKRQARAK